MGSKIKDVGKVKEIPFGRKEHAREVMCGLAVLSNRR